MELALTTSWHPDGQCARFLFSRVSFVKLGLGYGNSSRVHAKLWYARVYMCVRVSARMYLLHCIVGRY